MWEGISLKIFSRSLWIILLSLMVAFVSIGQTVSSDKDDYPPGETAHITGIGWFSDQVVHVEFKETPDYPDFHIYDAVVNEYGIWQIDYLIEERHLGVTFTVTATGAQSGYIATTVFTDGNLSNVTVGSQSAAITYGTAASVTYPVTVTANNTSGSFSVTMSSTGIPAGVTASMSPSSFTLAPNASQAVILTLTTQTNTRIPTNPTFTITATGGGGSGSKNGTGTITIGKKVLTGSISVNNKIYDGNVSAVISSRNLSGVLSGDVVTYMGGTATFSDKNIGNGKTVTAAGLSLTGANAGNYSVNTTASTTGDISPRGLTGSITAANKIYDGNTNATIINRSLTGAISGDRVDYTGGSANFDNKNAGTGKTVTATGLGLSGTDAGNYTVNETALTTAAVTSLLLTTSVTIEDKVYDGNTSATITGRNLIGVLNSEDVVLSGGTATFNNMNVGTNKKVTIIGLSLSGTESANYSVNSGGTSNADITAKPITVIANAGQTKIYGQTDPVYTYGVDPALIGSDAFSGALTRNPGEDVGSYAILQGSLTAGANYSITYSGADFSITPLGITGSFTADNKVYDGNTNATILTRSLIGVLEPDTLGINLTGGTAVFDTKDAGTSKVVTSTGMTLTGARAFNYSLVSVAITTADITPLGITGNFTADNKIYDGTTAAVILTRSLNGIIGPDVVSLNGGTASFDTKNVGTNKVVTSSDMTLEGDQAGNYSLTSVGTATASITVKSASVTVNAATKMYGQTDPSFTGTLNGFIASDGITGTYSRTPGETVAGSPYTISAILSPETELSNYNISYGTANFTITPAIVTAAVSLSTNPQQYSDLETFTATITGGAEKFAGEGAAAGSATFKVGTQVVGTANFVPSGADLVAVLANIQLIEPSPYETATPTGQMAPGAHTVTATINNINSNYSLNTLQPTVVLTITQEDDPVYYTGAVMVSTSGATSSRATITLSATLKDITAEPSNPAYDTYPGDIRNARVTFINRDNGAVIAADLPVGLANSSETKIGTATYNWSVDIGSSDAKQYTIGIIVKNYYHRNSNADNQVVTVAKPLDNFITGGGYINLSNSSGLKAGDTNSKNNFGFNVKFNKGGTNLQGNINIITRKTENGVLHVYQIKGNVMTSLSVNAAALPYSATFNGKASIRDITDPLNVIDVDGNSTLQVTMSDNGEPGSSDRISITVWNKNGGLWFASEWNGTRTIERTLSGNSNLKVKGGTSGTGRYINADSTTAADQKDRSIVTQDQPVKIYPNPTTGFFTVDVCKATVLEDARIEIINELGQVVYSKMAGMFNGCIKENIELSRDLPAGMYFLQLSVGKKMETTRIILAR
jgi:hypothetical protein